MDRFAGLDVSLASTTICVVDGRGEVLFEGSVASEPDAIVAALTCYRPSLVGLEAKPMSEWLHDGLAAHGFKAVLLETRHVHAALKASRVKTERQDALGTVQLL